MSVTNLALWCLGLLVVTLLPQFFAPRTTRKTLGDLLGLGYMAISAVISFGIMFITAIATGELPIISKYWPLEHIYNVAKEPLLFFVALVIDIATFIICITICWLAFKKGLTILTKR